MTDEATSRRTSASHRLAANTGRIIAEWEARVRAAVPAARGASHAILIDTLPALLRMLAEALAADHPRPTATAGSTIALEHGGERARLTSFRLDDLLAEYRTLRDVLLEVLEEDGPLTRGERTILFASMDATMQEASTSYVLVQEGLREQLFAIVAHDLRNPLAAARANLSLVLRKPGAPDVPRWAARAVEAVDRVDRMLQDMLDAMRVQAGAAMTLELTECDLVEITQQAAEHLESGHGDRFVVVAPAPVHGRFGAEAMRRAIENLGGNAVKYGDPARPITITVEQRHGRALVYVHNDGAHIPVEEQETIFRAFHRRSDVSAGGPRGWGLGLAQVRAVAEAHGGSIGVDSVPGRGTTFVIDVPLEPVPGAPTP